MTNKKDEKIDESVIGIIAGSIGVEPEDIHKEDTFKEDLHMSAADIADLIEKLKTNGFETKVIDLDNLTSIEDLVEMLS